MENLIANSITIPTKKIFLIILYLKKFLMKKKKIGLMKI